MESQSPTFKPSLVERMLISTFQFVNKYVAWHKLPTFIGAMNLDALRIELRANNLHDGYASGTAQGNRVDDPLPEKPFMNVRNSDGKFNSTELPLMGCSGMRFGRNFPRADTAKPTEKELWTPNPRMLSERFMTRKPGGFIPATSLNLLAAAWIQFQTHDWFDHETVR
jgi:Animal haem peroxidase